MKLAFVLIVLLGKRAVGVPLQGEPANVGDRGGPLSSLRFQRLKVPNMKCLNAAALVIDLHKGKVGIEYFLAK